ncbi:MAG: redoxin domain-containing protein, partial [Spirosomaceae bacterium]|nr:redoxin domain-containing protein [Spirosomataceae bacterium]
MPRIGDIAPDFEAVTTKGKIKLSDYAKDKWIVMFSHPAD